MLPKPFSPTFNKNAGFTIIELLMVLGVGALMLTFFLSIIIGSRNLFQVDRARTTTNQNLRAGLDLMASDLRQAGERLLARSGGVPYVLIENNNPDTLRIRRNLNDVVLPVCETITAGSTNNRDIEISASSTTATPSVCRYVNNTNSSQHVHDNLEVFRAVRTNNGANTSGTLRVYFYNPTTRSGEFVEYSAEVNNQGNFPGTSSRQVRHLRINPSNYQWVNSYDTNSRIYILEERLFRVNNEVLQMVINGDTNNPQNIIDNVTNFQVQANLNGTAVEAVTVNNSTNNAWWTTRWVELSLTARENLPGRSLSRTEQGRFFSRNFLSR